MRVTIHIQGITPLLMHNPRMVDPEYPLNREIKAITAKRKKTEEDLHNIEKLEWYGGLYEQDGQIVQPTSKPRKCFIETARIYKLGKALERALSFGTLYVPLLHDGPGDVDKLYEERRFHSRLSVGIGGKRVMRVRPQFLPWELEIDGIFVEDAGLNWDDLERIVEMAGVVTGIGDNRVNGYGRFEGKVTGK